MLALVTSGIQQVITWVGSVLDAIVAENGILRSLGPLFAIGISISVIYLGIRIVKSIVWGA